MTTTPLAGAPDWAASQASPWLNENQAKRMIEALARYGTIEDRDLTAPPGSCTDGACYLVKATATGAWAGKDGKLAVSVGVNAASGWYFVTVATEGVALYVKDEDVRIVYNGSAWASELPTTLTDGATVTPDFSAGPNFEWTMGGSRTLANPTNTRAGQTGTIKIVQDATGTRVVTYGSNWRFPGGSASGGVLTTTANGIDLLRYQVGSDGKIYAALQKAFAA